MKLKNALLFTLVTLAPFTTLTAQQGHTTVGFQYKPIVPSDIFNSGPDVLNQDNWNVSIQPKFSHTYGMVIRHGLSDRWSIEGGSPTFHVIFRLTQLITILLFQTKLLSSLDMNSRLLVWYTSAWESACT